MMPTPSRVGYVYDSGLADYIPFTGPPASLPSGMVTMTAANAAPSGWLLCNGSAISRTTYADLFTAIGTTYGTGDGSTTFNLPDLRGRVSVGTDSSQTEFDTLGETGGTKTETLTTAQIPSHTHTVSDPGHAHSVYDPGHSHYINSEVNRGSISGPANMINQPYNNSVIYTSSSGTGISIYSNTTGITNGNTGGGGSHNNLQPYIALNYIIKI